MVDDVARRFRGRVADAKLTTHPNLIGPAARTTASNVLGQGGNQGFVARKKAKETVGAVKYSQDGRYRQNLLKKIFEVRT